MIYAAAFLRYLLIWRICNSDAPCGHWNSSTTWENNEAPSTGENGQISKISGDMKSPDMLINTRRPSQCHRLVRGILAISDSKGDQTQIQIIQLQRAAKKEALASAEPSVLWHTGRCCRFLTTPIITFLNKKKWRKVLACFYHFLAKKPARCHPPSKSRVTQLNQMHYFAAFLSQESTPCSYSQGAACSRAWGYGA